MKSVFQSREFARGFTPCARTSVDSREFVMSEPEWKLERMLLGDIPPEEREKEKLDQLRREDEEILAAHPPAQAAAEIRRRAAQVVLHRPARPAI